MAGGGWWLAGGGWWVVVRSEGVRMMDESTPSATKCRFNSLQNLLIPLEGFSSGQK